MCCSSGILSETQGSICLNPPKPQGQFLVEKPASSSINFLSQMESRPSRLCHERQIRFVWHGALYRAKSWWKSSSHTPCAPVSWAVRALRTSDGLMGFRTRGAESRKFGLELMDKSIMPFYTSALTQHGSNTLLLRTGLADIQGTLDQTWLVDSMLCARNTRGIVTSKRQKDVKHISCY